MSLEKELWKGLAEIAASGGLASTLAVASSMAVGKISARQTINDAKAKRISHNAHNLVYVSSSRSSLRSIGIGFLNLIAGTVIANYFSSQLDNQSICPALGYILGGTGGLGAGMLFSWYSTKKGLDKYVEVDSYGEYSLTSEGRRILER